MLAISYNLMVVISALHCSPQCAIPTFYTLGGS